MSVSKSKDVNLYGKVINTAVLVPSFFLFFCLPFNFVHNFFLPGNFHFGEIQVILFVISTVGFMLQSTSFAKEIYVVTFLLLFIMIFSTFVSKLFGFRFERERDL